MVKIHLLFIECVKILDLVKTGEDLGSGQQLRQGGGTLVWGILKCFGEFRGANKILDRFT